MTTLNRQIDLKFFVDKIEKGEPFSSLLYGDGEFNVITGRVPIGTPYTQYKEVVTEKMQQELRDSLDCKDGNVYRGTDFHLLDWKSYQGTDVEMVRSVSEPIQSYLRGIEEHTYGVQVPNPIEWYDGTIWDTAVRNGQLGPFLKSIRNKRTCLVGCRELMKFRMQMGIEHGYATPDTDAGRWMDEMEDWMYRTMFCVPTFLFCMGLGAIPLIMRLRKKMPDATFIDLGSVLDVFIGLGGDRGWRREMYANPAKLKECIDKNLEGVL